MALSERIVLEGTINTRDLGGFKGADGKHIAFKRLIRTDGLYHLKPNDIDFLVKNYRPVWDIDLRSEAEVESRRDLAIPGCQFICLPFNSPDSKIGLEDGHSKYKISDHRLDHLIDYIHSMSKKDDVDEAMSRANREYVNSPIAIQSLKKFLEILKDTKDGCILFHCADGKDRTGYGAAIVLSLLGVSRKDIYEDYLKTNEYTKQKAEDRRLFLEKHVIGQKNLIDGLVSIAGVKKCWLDAALDEIDKNYGSVESFANKALGFTSKDIEELRRNYLE